MRLPGAILLTLGIAVHAAPDPEGAEVLSPSAPAPAPVVATDPRLATSPGAGDSAVARDSTAPAPAVPSVMVPVASPDTATPTPEGMTPLSPYAAPAPPATLSTDSVKTVASFRTIAIAMDTSGSARNGRSTWAAVGLTLLLPGSGHRYLGHKTGAAIWMTADLATWSSLLAAWRTGSLYLEDATEIANRHAGASLDADADPALLETIRDWRSRRPVQGRRDSYDEALLQQGLAPDHRFPEDAAHDWDWGSPEDPANNAHIAAFEDALRGYRTSRVVLTYAAGALLLSRTIAVADILRIRRGSASRAGVQASVVPGPDGGRARLAVSF